MTFAETLAGRLARDAERDGERIAFTFLPDGEGVDVSLSRAELHSRAIALAAYLQGRGLTGERVLLLHESSLDSVVALLACFYAGAIAVPAAPPARGAKSERLHGMVQDAQPRLALAGSNEKIGGLDVETIVTHGRRDRARSIAAVAGA